MLITLIPPEKSLKNLIVNLLLKNGELNVNELKKMIKEIFKISSTYQGVNKAVKQLEESKIIYFKEKKYSVDHNWIKNIVETLKEYPKNHITIYTTEIKELKFDSISDALTFIVNNVESGALLNSGENLCIAHMNNLGFWSLDKHQIEKMKKAGSKMMCIFIMSKSNFVTRAASRFFKRANFQIYLGVPKSTPYITAIIGNTLLTIMSNNEIKYFSELYEDINSIEDERMLEIFESAKLENKFDVRIIFETDKQIVDGTKQHLLELIKDARKL